MLITPLSNSTAWDVEAKNTLRLVTTLQFPTPSSSNATKEINYHVIFYVHGNYIYMYYHFIDSPLYPYLYYPPYYIGYFDWYQKQYETCRQHCNRHCYCSKMIVKIAFNSRFLACIINQRLQTEASNLCFWEEGSSWLKKSVKHFMNSQGNVIQHKLRYL